MAGKERGGGRGVVRFPNRPLGNLPGRIEKDSKEGKCGKRKKGKVWEE